MNPPFVDQRPHLDVVEDQGIYGACTGFAGAKAMDIIYDRAGLTRLFSPMYLWAKERIDAGVMPQNIGVSPGEIFTVMEKYGVCLESSMPNVSPVDMMPTAAMDAEAAQYRTAGHTLYGMDWDGKITLERVKTALAKGIPVLATIYVKPSLFSVTGPWRTHTWNFILDADNQNVGMHEFVLIGYDDESQHLLVQNSWGPQYGDGGFLGVPYLVLSWNEISQFALFIEIKAAGVRYVNAGWRPDLSAAQTMVQWAYIAYFGRPADLAGMNYWADGLSTMSMAVVLDSFANSAESMALYGARTAAGVITAAYQQLFGRNPDGPGLAYWSALVDSGQLTLGAVIFAIVQGAQGSDAVSIAAKVEAASVLTYDENYVTSKIAAARTWLAWILNPSQVQTAVEALP